MMMTRDRERSDFAVYRNGSGDCYLFLMCYVLEDEKVWYRFKFWPLSVYIWLNKLIFIFVPRQWSRALSIILGFFFLFFGLKINDI